MPRRLDGRKAAILRNHGLLTVGQTVDEAVWWFVSMERCCQAQFLAESVCKPLQIDSDNARATRSVNGAPTAGWLRASPFGSASCASSPTCWSERGKPPPAFPHSLDPHLCAVYAAELRLRGSGGAISASAGMPHSRCSRHAMLIVRGRLPFRTSDARWREPSRRPRSAWVKPPISMR